jgi:hypothetical protein
MNTTRLGITLPLAILVAGVAVAASSAAESQLKWKPHRDATSSAPGTLAEVPQAAVAPEPAALPPMTPAAAAATAPAAGGPAAVVLPDEVPRTTPPQRVAAARPVPPRPRAAAPIEASTTARIAGSLERVFNTTDETRVFGMSMRTPQGEGSRRILAPEGRQAVAMEQRAESVELTAGRDERLGGGLAPRYTTTPGSRPRIAMNADGLPSVMSAAQRSPVGGLDDAQVPSRAPASAAPAASTPPPTAPRLGESLPTPSSTAPSVTEEMPLSIESFEPGMGMGDGDPSIAMPDGMPMGDDGSMMGDGGMLMGEYPTQLHVESFYDDPYACEDEDPFCNHSGRFCAWLRRFGKPYYGWRWYRDFSASAGVTAFTNDTNLGLLGNFGTNEYLNWAMPFWNAFGIGWQVGWRGTQTNFQPSTLTVGGETFRKHARDQNFVTTGFFTRAFEGRGLQGGAVYDYLSDSWLENADISQIRAELSYVWGYHEIGFWGAANIYDQNGSLGRRSRAQGTASTVDLYTGFYRLQFGDANEWKVWGGGTGDGEGIVGSLLRAPLSRSLAMEGTFTYLIPGQTRTVDVTGSGVTTNFSPAAWNVGVNLVWYPAGRSRRGLASPYRPLFEVADNGSMIRQFDLTTPKP